MGFGRKPLGRSDIDRSHGRKRAATRVLTAARHVARATAVLAICALPAIGASRASAQTLMKIKERANVICGVNPGLPGFSTRDDKGNWSGFDVDFCRALSAAI